MKFLYHETVGNMEDNTEICLNLLDKVKQNIKLPKQEIDNIHILMQVVGAIEETTYKFSISLNEKNKTQILSFESNATSFIMSEFSGNNLSDKEITEQTQTIYAYTIDGIEENIGDVKEWEKKALKLIANKNSVISTYIEEEEL